MGRFRLGQGRERGDQAGRLVHRAGLAGVLPGVAARPGDRDPPPGRAHAGHVHPPEVVAFQRDDRPDRARRVVEQGARRRPGRPGPPRRWWPRSTPGAGAGRAGARSGRSARRPRPCCRPPRARTGARRGARPRAEPRARTRCPGGRTAAPRPAGVARTQPGADVPRCVGRDGGQPVGGPPVPDDLGPLLFAAGRGRDRAERDGPVEDQPGQLACARLPCARLACAACPPAPGCPVPGGPCPVGPWRCPVPGWPGRAALIRPRSRGLSGRRSRPRPAPLRRGPPWCAGRARARRGSSRGSRRPGSRRGPRTRPGRAPPRAADGPFDSRGHPAYRPRGGSGGPQPAPRSARRPAGARGRRGMPARPGPAASARRSPG